MWVLRAALLAGAALCAVLLCVSLYMIAATMGSIYSAPLVPPAQAALLLGASVSGSGTLSPVLRERADTAVMLYRAGKVQKILVTGDDSTLTYDEVYPVGKYLLAAGVPKQDIFLDYAGFDTYSSVYRAHTIFNAQSLIVVSQRFHLPRALFIAHALGVPAVGVDAGLPGELYLGNALREIPASSKALWDILTRRVPKYLGAQFPLAGEGTPTWVGSSTQMIYFAHGQ